MSKKIDGISDTVGDILIVAVGWAFCLTILIGFYGLGYWVAPYVAGEQHRESFAMLSSIVLIWLYEHRRSEARWERLNEQISHLYEQVSNSSHGI